MDIVIGILVLLVLGLVVGALAKFLMPGDDPGGIIATSILGIVGALVGGWIARALDIGGITGFDWRSLVAVGGSMLLLLLYRAFRMLVPYSTATSDAASPKGYESDLRANSLLSDTSQADTVSELTETVKGAFSANDFQKLSGMLGESPNAARKALEAIVPTILAGMSNQVSSPGGVSRLFDMAKDAAGGGTDLFGRLEHHLSAEGLDDLTRKGRGILNAIFGDKLNGLVSWISRFAGIKESSASSLMGVASNLVLSTLGKNILQKGLTPATFSSMLSSLRGPLARLLPSGIGDVPGMRALADLGDRAATTTRAAVETGRRAGASAFGSYRESVGAARQGTPWLAALLPLALLALPLLAFAYLMRGTAARLMEQAENVQVSLPQPKANQISVPAARPAEFAVQPGERPLVETAFVEKLIEAKLPDGKTLKLPQASFLNGVFKYLSDPASRNGQCFVFENLEFDASTVTVTPATQTAIDELRVLLTSYTHPALRIDGYTDDSGSPAKDKALSQDRAEAVKALLVKAGVPSETIIAAGQGAAKPLEPSDSEEHRAKNRRIELAFEK